MNSTSRFIIIIFTILSFQCNQNINNESINKAEEITSTSTNPNMKQVLQQISINTINGGEFKSSELQIKTKWLGNSPASSIEIEKAENRLNVIFPNDYKLFLENCNGFPASSFIEPTFHPVNEIDYLRNVDPELIEIWIETGNVEEGKILNKSIIIAEKMKNNIFC